MKSLLLAGMFIVMAVVGCSPSVPSGWAANGKVRSEMSEIDSKEVVRVELKGPKLSLNPKPGEAGEFGDPQIAADPAKVREWVEAFKVSMRKENLDEQTEDVGNAADVVTFHGASGVLGSFYVHPDDLPDHHGPEITRLYKLYRKR